MQYLHLHPCLLGSVSKCRYLIKCSFEIQVQLGGIISICKRRVEEVRESYELQGAEEKDMDKYFKKEFADCEPFVDLLYKFFKKRPRGQRSSISGGYRRKDSRVIRGGGGGGIGGVGGVKNAMAELDHISHLPEGMDVAIWDRLVAYRHRKVESEIKVHRTTSNM